MVMWRVLKISLSMIWTLFRYFSTRHKGAGARERFLRDEYVRWANRVLRTFDAALEIQGREHLPPADGRPRIFMCNHQSQLDIPALVIGIQETLGFVAKRELRRIPLLNYWMRQVGCVFIDRSDRSGARKSLEEAAAKIGSNPMVVFPEGTRSKTGQLLPLKLGGLRMAVLAGARVIPVHVRNTRNACEARSANVPVPIPMRLRFFPVMEMRDLKDEKASWVRARDYIEECWRLGESEAKASSAR